MRAAWSFTLRNGTKKKESANARYQILFPVQPDLNYGSHFAGTVSHTNC